MLSTVLDCEYRGTLIIGNLGRQKLVRLVRWPLCQGGLNDKTKDKTKKCQMGRPKGGPISKVVRLSGWSHSKVPL